MANLGGGSFVERIERRSDLAVEAVIGEPVSASYSLFCGNIQGNLAT